MTFDFENIKVINMLKKIGMNTSEFKGVLDPSTGKMWPFGSDKAREFQKRKFGSVSI